MKDADKTVKMTTTGVNKNVRMQTRGSVDLRKKRQGGGGTNESGS